MSGSHLLIRNLLVSFYNFNFFLQSASKEASNEPSEEKADKDKKDESGSSTEESKKSEKVKIVTKDRDLLLACSYFDLGHCGYFETKDLEDILTTINLNLSRAQIKKLVKEVTSGKDQQVNYRQFTDKPEDPKLAETEVTSKIEPEEVDLSKEETLGQGFKAFVPKPKRDHQESSVNSSSIATDGICSYRGKLFLELFIQDFYRLFLKVA